jgi:glycosyltransferase involved in cell wall biosynthesis
MEVNKKVKILMGIPSKSIKMGGPTTHLPYLVDYFKNKQQYMIRTFIYGSKIDGGSLINKSENILSKSINTLNVFFLFIYNIAVFRPHIIHINTAFDKKSLLRDIPFSLFSFLFRQKLIFKIHGSSYDLINTHSKFFLCLIRLFFLGAKRVGVLSEIEKNEFIKKFGHLKKMVVVKNMVLPNQTTDIDITEFNYFTKEPFNTYGLFVSRIIKGKGLDDVIRALPLVLKVNPHFNLLVAGDGPEKKSYLELAIELNVNESIIWLGIIPNNLLSNIYASSEIFIFPSHFPEGMPMVLMDALKSGIPIITSRVRFAVNYLEENKNCLFIDPGNIRDIAYKINGLIINKELQGKMKKFNPEIIKVFDKEIVGEEFINIYQDMLNG